jgi:hypothetical protein
MHRRISENWWRRWAGWSFAWVLGWLLLIVVISDGPAYAPGDAVSTVLAFIFGAPILALAVRWGFPRASHLATLIFKSEDWERRKASAVAQFERYADSFRATIEPYLRSPVRRLDGDDWKRHRAWLAGHLAQFSGALRARVAAFPASRSRPASAESHDATDKTAEVAGSLASETGRDVKASGPGKAAQSHARKSKNVRAGKSKKKQRRHAAGKAKSAARK